MGVAWGFPQVFAGQAVRIVRRVVGGLLLIAAITMFMARRGML